MINTSIFVEGSLTEHYSAPLFYNHSFLNNDFRVGIYRNIQNS